MHLRHWAKSISDMGVAYLHKGRGGGGGGVREVRLRWGGREGGRERVC